MGHAVRRYRPEGLQSSTWFPARSVRRGTGGLGVTGTKVEERVRSWDPAGCSRLTHETRGRSTPNTFEERGEREGGGWRGEGAIPSSKEQTYEYGLRWIKKGYMDQQNERK